MARTYNGTTQFIVADAAHVSSMNSAFSVSSWLKCANTVTNADFYSESSSSTNNPFFQFQTNSGKIRVILRRDSNSGTSDVNAVTSTTTAADNTWHHVLFSQDGSGHWKVYIDGLLDSTCQGTYTTQTMTCNRVTFAAIRRSTNSNFWAGTSMEIANWTRQLSAGEALLLASGLPASHLGPSHYWPCWGIDSPEPDIGNATHTSGTITGATSAIGGRTLLNLINFS